MTYKLNIKFHPYDYIYLHSFKTQDPISGLDALATGSMDEAIDAAREFYALVYDPTKKHHALHKSLNPVEMDLG